MENRLKVNLVLSMGSGPVAEFVLVSDTEILLRETSETIHSPSASSRDFDWLDLYLSGEMCLGTPYK